MLKQVQVPWSIFDVIMLYIFRILSGMFFAGLNLPGIEIIDRLVILLLVVLFLKMRKVDLADYGFTTQNFFHNILVGFSYGVLILVVSTYVEKFYVTVFMLEPGQHPIIAGLKQNHTLSNLVISMILAGLITPVAEEVLYRMFTFLPLKRCCGLFGGAVISAVIFALLHFNLPLLAELITVGLALVFVYYTSGSLIVPIAAHSTVNTAKLLLVYWGVL